jgi:mRNA interferase MazF|tara:strand:+ start:774 stop:1097 length:324 start_codon:yes stop_codon:yes gene_type:complete
MFERGDIVLIPFPYTDLTGIKKRPAIIISNLNLSGDDKICCLVTSNNPKDGILISKGSVDDGVLPFKSWVKPHRIFTIDNRIIVKKLARAEKKLCDQIKEKVDYFIE